MNVRLHIERLVFNGVPVSEAALPHVQAAIEAELAQLMARGGLAAELTAERVVPSLAGGDVRMSAGGGDAALGRQIAVALYEGIGR
jgi:hypothetical protein